MDSVREVIIGVVSGFLYYISTRFTVTVRFSDVESIAIYETSTYSEDGGKLVRKLEESPATVSLSKEKGTYGIVYTGKDGFIDGLEPIDKADSQITISPEYSNEKYKQIMSSELPNIHSILRSKYPAIDTLYSLEPVVMLNRGEWFVVRLRHTASDSTNTDSLRVLFKKEDNSWKLAAGPSIVFTTKANPDIDRSILVWANDSFVE